VIWVWVVVTVVLVGAVAVVVAGREDGMAEVYDDRPDVSFPVGRPLTPSDLDHLRFSTGVRGYRMDEVDAFVARVKADLLAREEIAQDVEPAEPEPETERDRAPTEDSRAGGAGVSDPAAGGTAGEQQETAPDAGRESEDATASDSPPRADSPERGDDRAGRA
jgi:DivIVA domain-containing protein